MSSARSNHGRRHKDPPRANNTITPVLLAVSVVDETGSWHHFRAWQRRAKDQPKSSSLDREKRENNNSKETEFKDEEYEHGWFIRAFASGFAFGAVLLLGFRL